MNAHTFPPAPHTPATPLVPVHRARCGCCLVIDCCPHCGKRHTHGAAGRPKRGLQFHGHRLAHCADAPIGAGYWLVEPATPPPITCRVVKHGVMACAAKPQVVRSRPSKRRAAK
jgi:hypothetical protein